MLLSYGDKDHVLEKFWVWLEWAHQNPFTAFAVYGALVLFKNQEIQEDRSGTHVDKNLDPHNAPE